MQPTTTAPSLAAAVSITIFLVGCGGDKQAPTDPTPSAPATISIAAGNSQQVAAGEAVPVAPAVVVRDASGSPVAGVSVTFAVAAGGGALTGVTPTTNTEGIATVSSWVVGTSGVQRVTATTGSLAPVEFQATITPGTEHAVAAIGAGGGTFTINIPGNVYHGLRLTVPSGMYPSSTQWRMRVGTLSPNFTTPSGFTVLGPPLVVETAALRGDKLMTLDIPVNADEDDLVFVALHDPARGVAELLPTIGRTASTVVVATGHLRGALLPGASVGAMLHSATSSAVIDPPTQVIPLLLDQLSSVQTSLNRWPVTDHGSQAHPNGLGLGIAALQRMATAGGFPSFESFVKPLSLPGFYAEAGPLGAAQLSQERIRTGVDQVIGALDPLFDQHAKARRDELVRANAIASMLFSNEHALIGFTHVGTGLSGLAPAVAATGNSMTLFPASMSGPAQLTFNAGTGFAPLTLPPVGGRPQDVIAKLVPLSSAVLDLAAIGDVLTDLVKVSQAVTPELRRQANAALATKAGLPALELQFRNDLDDEWRQIASQEMLVVARKQTAQVKLVDLYFSMHRPSGEVLVISEGEPVSILEDAEVGSAPKGTRLLRPVSANVRGSDGVLRQANVATVELAFDPFELSPEEVTLTAQDMVVELDASVLLPPAGYRIDWDWGDGTTTQHVGQTSASHIYEQYGEYEVVARLIDLASGSVLAADTVQVKEAPSAWVGQVIVTQTSANADFLHTIHMSATNLRFERNVTNGAHTTYKVVSGFLSLYNDVPCANYVSPTVQVGLTASPSVWLQTRSEDPYAPAGAEPDQGLWFLGNAAAFGLQVFSKACISEENPDPEAFVLATGAVWLNTYQAGSAQTWRKAPNPNVIEGAFTQQNGDLIMTWSWRFDRVND